MSRMTALLVRVLERGGNRVSHDITEVVGSLGLISIYSELLHWCDLYCHNYKVRSK